MIVKRLNQDEFVRLKQKLMQKVMITGVANIDQRTLIMIAKELGNIHLEFGKHAGKNLYKIIVEEKEYSHWLFENEAGEEIREDFFKAIRRQ